MTYELVASVVGLTNNYKEPFGSRPGVGKSCLCFRLAYPEFDSYVDNHPSLFALHEFESRAINSNHFIYWGSPVKFFPVKGGDCKIKFHIIEQTVFYQDVTAFPFNHSTTKPDHIDNYIKRIVGPIESRGKVSYHSRDALTTGIPAGHMAVNYPSGTTRLPRGFIVVFDVSVSGKALDMQYKRVDPILSYLNKHKKKFIIAVTKRDKYSMPSLEMAYDLRKKHRTHLVECSALDDLNTEEVLRVLALIVITKKTSGLSDQVMRYHDAAQHVLLRRTSAKSAFKSYIRKKVQNYDERLPSVQKSEEFKECARWIGSHKTGCIFALHVLETYNTKIEESYAGVREDTDMHFEYLEDFIDQRADIEPYKAEMRRWISTYMMEFSRQVSASKLDKPSVQAQINSTDVSKQGPGTSTANAEVNVVNQVGEVTSTVSSNNGSPSPRATARVPPAIPKPTPVPEGYHIFESVSKVNKEGSKQDTLSSEEAVETNKDLAEEEERGSGGDVQENTDKEENSRRESGTCEDEKNEDGDTVSNYSSDSMESVSDHDYLNFDPKALSGLSVDDDSSLFQGDAAKKTDTSGTTLTTPKQPSSGEGNDESSDVDYENMQDFVGDYMNMSDTFSTSRESNHLQANMATNGGNKVSPAAADEQPGEELGESKAADRKENISAAPQVSPKPLVKKRSQANQPPPLTLPTSPPAPLNPIASSDLLPTSSLSSTSSSSPSASECVSSPLSQSRPPSGPKKPKPNTPVRKSSLNTTTTFTSLKGSKTPPATHRTPGATAPVDSKTENLRSRSSSIKQRAKLLELSMTSSTVTQDDEVQQGTEAQGDDSSQGSNKQINNFHSKPPLPVLEENPHLVKVDILQVEASDSTLSLDQASSSNNGVRGGGEVDTSCHLAQQSNSLETVRSPATTTSLPTACLPLASSSVNQSPQDPGTSTSNGLHKRPRLTQIKNKLAQKKEAEAEEETCSETSEVGSVDEVFSPTSSIPADRPSLAKIRQKLKGGGSLSSDRDIGTAQKEHGRLEGVSPSSSINLPPIPPKLSSVSPSVKRGSAPATVINQTMDPDKLKEWNDRRQKRMEEREKNRAEGPPPLPERTLDMFELSRPPKPTFQPRNYQNTQLKDGQQTTSKPVSADDSTVSPNHGEAAELSKKKKRVSSYLLNKLKKEEGEKTSPVKKVSSKKEEATKTKDQISPTKKAASKKTEEGTKQKEHTSPIKKLASKYPFQKIKPKNQADERESEQQTKAKFIVMANRPLPTLPGHSQKPGVPLDHTDDDYEDFAFDSVPVEYMNYPQLPMEAVSSSSKMQRSQSQEPEKTTHSAPNTPKSRTLGRSGKPNRPVPPRTVSTDQPDDIDGYVNTDEVPEMSASVFHGRPLPSRPPPPPVGDKKSKDDLDYDYPDLRLAGAFTTNPALQAAMAKYEMSKLKVQPHSQPVHSQRMEEGGAGGVGVSSGVGRAGGVGRTGGVGVSSGVGRAGGVGVSSGVGKASAQNMVGSEFDDDDDQVFRDRTCSDASSAYVPMDGWLDLENPYMNTDAMPPVDAEQSLLPPRNQDFKSASDSNISAAGVDQKRGKEQQEAEDESWKVYMNLPAPEKFATLPPPRSSLRFQNPTSSLPARVPTKTKRVSLDDSHTTSKYPITKPRPKVRSATVAAEPPTGLHPPHFQEAWNKTGIPREAEGSVRGTGALPPRNIPRI